MYTKKAIPIITVLALILGAAIAPQPVQAAVIDPEITVIDVDRNDSVRVRGNDFPANSKFDVYMFPYGADPDESDLVDTITTPNDDDFEETFDIPGELYGVNRIVIFMESRDGKYDVSTWFYNQKSSPPDDYEGYPSFTIPNVVKDKEVTLKFHNLPPDDRFYVLMDEMGSQAKNGIQVGVLHTYEGGNWSQRYAIPSALKGESKIAVRIESSWSGYYYYNWFYNTTSSTSGGSKSTGSGGPRPTISINSVDKDKQIKFALGGIPKGDQFLVLMDLPDTSWDDAAVLMKMNYKFEVVVWVTAPILPQFKGKEKIAILVKNVDTGAVTTTWFYNK